MTEQKEPVYVHCLKCKHDWIVCYLPMEAAKAARIIKANGKYCPSCGAIGPAIGRYPHPTPKGDALAWRNGGDTGTSSLTIYTTMMGEPFNRPCYPLDPADFGRCYRLLQIMPEWRARLGEVAAKYPNWRGLVDAWDELTALYLEELPTGRCQKLYDRMHEIEAQHRLAVTR